MITKFQYILFLLIYLQAIILAPNLTQYSKIMHNTILFYIFILCEICFILSILFFNVKYKIFKIKHMILIIFFCCFVFVYIWIEQIIIKLVMYNLFDEGGIVRYIMKDWYYNFKIVEVLFWNFIFSLHYFLYLFFIIKPFFGYVNKISNKYKCVKKDNS